MNSISDDRRIRLQTLLPDRTPPADAWQRLSARLHAEPARPWVSPPAVMASVALLVAGIVAGLLVQPGKDALSLEGVTHDPGGPRLFILTEEGRQPVPAERYAGLTIYDLDAVHISPEANGDDGHSPEPESH